MARFWQSNDSKENQELEFEITKSELLRIKLIIAFSSIIFIFFTFLTLFFEQAFIKAMKNRVLPHSFLYLFGTLIIVYTLIYLQINRFHRKKVILPFFPRLLNAIFEGSIPTIVMIIVYPQNDPVGGISSPPIFAYSFFIILSVLRLNFYISLLTGISAAAGYMYFIYSKFSSMDISLYDSILFTYFNHGVKTAFLILAGIIAGFVATQLRKRISETILHIEQRREIESIFGQHVSPQVVETIIDSKQRDIVKEVDVSILFLDIRGFTSFSENRTPQEVYNQLNLIFEFMIEIINKNQGIINKFLGDGFLAIFGAPLSLNNHAQAALNAAKEIIADFEQKKQSGMIAPLDIGIGIHSGQALTGNVGSTNRKEFTIIGDVVNTASRIEQLTKNFHAKIIISHQTHKILEIQEGIKLEEAIVKGKEQKLITYKIA